MSSPELSLTWHFVRKWAERKPQAEALVFENERLTWAEFAGQVDRIAKALLELGVEKGDRVAFLSMARNEFLTTYMAAGKIGAVWLGVSPKFSVDEIAYMLNDCQPKVLISLHEYLGRDLVGVGKTMVEHLPGLRAVLMIGDPVEGTNNFAAFVNQPRPHLDAALAQRAAEVRPEDPALLLYTSGSTGHPKGVLHTHNSIVKNIQVEAAQLEVTDDSRLLLHFPINHVAADVEIGFGAVYAGATTVSMDRFDPERSLRTIERERITMVGQVPAMYLLQMQHPAFREVDFSHVKIFVWSGASAPRVLGETLAAIGRKTGARLINGYGMTETCGFVTYTDPDADLDLLLSSAGKAAPPFELKIVDDARHELPDGEVGEIAVRGELLMHGYWNNPKATADVFNAEGWFYTSDLARKDPDGNIHIAGRKSEMFKTGGENVFPREVEGVIEMHPAVLGVAVIAVPDEVYTEVGRAFVLLRPGQTAGEEDLRQHCRVHLANFKVPKRIEICAQLPLLPNGKVNKRALKDEILKRGV